jgi:hypothetical protein
MNAHQNHCSNLRPATEKSSSIADLMKTYTPLFEEITKNIKNRAFVNETEVLHDYGEPLGASVSERSVDPFLSHRKSELCETISRCQENPRLEIHRSLLGMVLKCVRQYQLSWSVESMFNFDEVEILAWEDWVPRKVIVAVSMSHQTTHHRGH